ncbi:unnamed protein product, partial [Medioppia subpectinata]
MVKIHHSNILEHNNRLDTITDTDGTTKKCGREGTNCEAKPDELPITSPKVSATQTPKPRPIAEVPTLRTRKHCESIAVPIVTAFVTYMQTFAPNYPNRPLLTAHQSSQRHRRSAQHPLLFKRTGSLLDDKQHYSERTPKVVTPENTDRVRELLVMGLFEVSSDVCVSCYHFHHMIKKTIDWVDFSQLFIDGHLSTGDWLSHVTDFWLTYGTVNHPNVLFIAYEELIADSAAMIATIARFLGKQFTAETVANITTHCSLQTMRDITRNSAAMIATIARFIGKQFTAETVANITTHCSLQTMRDNPMANHSDIMTASAKPGAQFVRKGIIGDWRAHMTDTQSALFDERFGQPLRAIGLRVFDNLASAETCIRTTGRIINNWRGRGEQQFCLGCQKGSRILNKCKSNMRITHKGTAGALPIVAIVLKTAKPSVYNIESILTKGNSCAPTVSRVGHLYRALRHPKLSINAFSLIMSSKQTFVNTSNEGICDQYMNHNSQHNSVNIDYTESMDKMLNNVLYAAIIDTEPEAQESGVQNGRQPQQQSRLVVVSGRSQRIVQNILDFGFGGDRKADDEFRTLLDNAFKGKSRTNGVTDRVDDELWRGFAVFTRTTDRNRFQQISRHIARQSAQNKPSIWFMFTGIRPGIARSVPALMTIPAFKASVEMSAQLLSPLGVDAIECLTETKDKMTALDNQNIHRVFIAIIIYHLAFDDTLNAVGITPDGYLGGSLGELMCLYMDGLCDRRQCLAICHAICPSVGPHPLWALCATNAWHEIRRHCMDRTDICPSGHFSDSCVTAYGTEVAVRELRDVLGNNNVLD